jgi:hypothetical protein
VTSLLDGIEFFTSLTIVIDDTVGIDVDVSLGVVKIV